MERGLVVYGCVYRRAFHVLAAHCGHFFGLAAAGRAGNLVVLAGSIADCGGGSHGNGQAEKGLICFQAEVFS